MFHHVSKSMRRKPRDETQAGACEAFPNTGQAASPRASGRWRTLARGGYENQAPEVGVRAREMRHRSAEHRLKPRDGGVVWLEALMGQGSPAYG